MEPEAVSGLIVAAQLAFTVDPLVGSMDTVTPGTVGLRDGTHLNLMPGGAVLDRSPVTGGHVDTRIRCEGCGDEDLSNQTITVRFTVGEVVLAGVDFRRTDFGEVIPAMSCGNCVVREAVLRGVEPSTLPA